MSQPSQLSQTLEVTRGDTKEWAFVAKDGNGQPFDLSELTEAFFTAKHSIADADPGVLQKTESDGITIDFGASGTGSVKLEPADTASLADARVVLVWDLQVTVDGNVYTLAGGQLLVYPDTTRS